MNDQTRAKFAEILAAAQAKETGKSTPLAAKAQDQPKNNPQPAPGPLLQQFQPDKIAEIEEMKNEIAKDMTEEEKPKMVSFFIHWHEGTGQFDNTDVKTWAEADRIFRTIYRQHGDSLGYTKVKCTVKWENGAEITDRIDVGNSGGDYSPAKYNGIGDYLSRQNGVMYASTLQKGDRRFLSFKDIDSAPEPEPELSTLTVGDILNDGNYCQPSIFPGFAAAAPQRTATKPQPKTEPLELVKYSDRSFALFGNSVHLYDKLYPIGVWNNRLKHNGKICGGWIFSVKHEQLLKRIVK